MVDYRLIRSVLLIKSSDLWPVRFKLILYFASLEQSRILFRGQVQIAISHYMHLDLVHACNTFELFVCLSTGLKLNNPVNFTLFLVV